jgi:hypothetical protein
MAISRPPWAALLLPVALAATFLPSTFGRGSDGVADLALAKHGLKLAGSLAIAAEEGELKTKLTEARRLSKQLSYAIVKQRGTMSVEEQKRQSKAVTDEINQLKNEINAVTQQMARVPRGGGRYGSRFGGGNSFTNNYAAEMYAELNLYKTQLQAELNEDTAFLNQLKSQPADPKAKDKIDAEVQDRRNSYHQAILELRNLVDAAHARYKEAGANDEVQNALNRLGKGQREKPKLGPSHDFLANVKAVERLEQAESGEAGRESSGRSTRKSRNRTRTGGPAATPAAEKRGGDAGSTSSP